MPLPLRAHVHRLLDGPARSRAATIVRTALAALIVANVAAVVVETVPGVQQAAGHALLTFEVVSLVVFSIEYLLRLWSAPEQPHLRGRFARLRWAVTPAALIDLLAIVPAFLPAHLDLRLLRLARLLRLLRVAKLGRYSLALRTLQHVLRQKAPDLLSLAFVLLILLVLSSSLMFLLEHDAQPEAFSSIPATMWWGIVTLTTIGYGDMTPVTIAGRLLGAVVALLGIGMFALPAGLLGAAFVEELGRERQRRAAVRSDGPGLAAAHERPADPHTCPHCRQPLPE